MKRWLRHVCLMLVLILSIPGSVLAVDGMGGAPTGVNQADVALERALEHYRAGKLNEAAGLLRGFLVSQADSPLVEIAYLQLARIHAELGEPDLALDYLQRASTATLTPADQLFRAHLLVQTDQAVAAFQQLHSLSPANLTLSEQQDYWLISSETALQLDQPQRALYFLYRALLSEGQESPHDVLGRARSLMDDRLDSQDLAEAAFLYRETPIGLLAMLQLGWQALAADRNDLAQQWVAAVLAGPVGFAYREEALTLQAQLSDPSQVQRAIGVLLPLSGRYAAFGELVQRGIELAQASFKPAVPVRVLYYDTAADPSQAARQVGELALGERVVALIGPLVGSAAETAAAKANQYRVPMLALSQKDGLAATGPYVFRNSLTSALQVQALVDQAMDVMGLTQFGILAPETRQGQQLAARFAEEVLRRGGTLVAQQSYDSDQTDFRRQVRLLRGLDPDAPDEEEEPPAPQPGEPQPEEEPPPFEALFLPDYAEKIGLLAPQLEFYGLKNVQLLGTNGWNDPELVRVAGPFVEGAIFVDGFFRNSPYPFVQEFINRYFETYGTEPTILEAQGYDAAGIILTLLNRTGSTNRELLRQTLSRLTNYPGVTGATRFDFQGEADKVLFLLQIQDGAIVQIN